MVCGQGREAGDWMVDLGEAQIPKGHFHSTNQLVGTLMFSVDIYVCWWW